MLVLQPFLDAPKIVVMMSLSSLLSLGDVFKIAWNQRRGGGSDRAR